MTASGPILVIGYGNTLRGDDGAGVVAATTIGERHWPGVEVVISHQLTPELAEPLAAAAAAFFIDAGIGPAESPVVIAPVIAPICPQSAENGWTHTTSPGRLLALAETVFGRSPPAWLVTLFGRDFTLNEHLSPHAIAAVAEAVALIGDRIAQQSASL